MRIPLVNLAAQYRSIRPEVENAFSDVFSKSQFILGEELAKLEREFADFIGVRYAVGVANGLDALRLSLEGLGIGAGAEVVLPANTFIATALAVSAVGARPILADCDRFHYGLDPVSAANAITARTCAIVPVHLAGQPADMDPILKLSQRYRLSVIEDSAQAHGALYQGKRCGSFGAAGCFSFYPSKNLGAYGDGGMIVTNNGQLAGRLRQLRNYGQRKRDQHAFRGTNSRLDTLQAAALRVKLRYLNRWNIARARHADRLKSLLEGVGDLSFQKKLPGTRHVYHLFLVETSRRDRLRQHLAALGIQTGIHYPTPIHMQPAYRDLGYKKGAFPNAELIASRTLSLPIYPELSDRQIDQIAGAIRLFFARGKHRPRIVTRKTS